MELDLALGASWRSEMLSKVLIGWLRGLPCLILMKDERSATAREGGRCVFGDGYWRDAGGGTEHEPMSQRATLLPPS